MDTVLGLVLVAYLTSEAWLPWAADAVVLLLAVLLVARVRGAER